jgi:hypothetical protein
MASNPML